MNPNSCTCSNFRTGFIPFLADAAKHGTKVSAYYDSTFPLFVLGRCCFTHARLSRLNGGFSFFVNHHVRQKSHDLVSVARRSQGDSSRSHALLLSSKHDKVVGQPNFVGPKTEQKESRSFEEKFTVTSLARSRRTLERSVGPAEPKSYNFSNKASRARRESGVSRCDSHHSGRR